MRGIVKQRKTFEEVLIQSDDQVIVRELLNKYVPDQVKEQILKEYNDEVACVNGRQGLN